MEISNGKTTHAATTGPAKGPRPASSMPAITEKPRFRAARSSDHQSIVDQSFLGDRGASDIAILSLCVALADLQSAEIYRISRIRPSGQKMSMARPITRLRGKVPQKRLSLLLLRLSPMTNRSF